MVFLGCRESLETIHQENWWSEPRLEPAGAGITNQGFKCFYFIEADSSSPASCQQVQLYLAGCLVYTCQL